FSTLLVPILLVREIWREMLVRVREENHGELSELGSALKEARLPLAEGDEFSQHLLTDEVRKVALLTATMIVARSTSDMGSGLSEIAKLLSSEFHTYMDEFRELFSFANTHANSSHSMRSNEFGALLGAKKFQHLVEWVTELRTVDGMLVAERYSRDRLVARD